MLLNALSFLTGVCLVQQFMSLPDLADYYTLLVLSSLAILAAHRSVPILCRRLFVAITFFVYGMVIAIWHGQSYLVHRLPEHLAGQDIWLSGEIIELPVTRSHVHSFILQVDEAWHDDNVIQSKYFSTMKVKLNWYDGKNVSSGEKWQLLVRLKPPHGFLNPGGSDYEAWLYQQGIHAIGYVRKHIRNNRLATANPYSILALRQSINIHVEQVLLDHPYRGIIRALISGDRSAIEADHWKTLIKTGTNHLIAISGLHIGLAAFFGYFFTRCLIFKPTMRFMPMQKQATIGALLVACFYACLAGWSIPTQRAFIMLLFLSFTMLVNRQSNWVHSLSWALLVVLIINPASVLSAGFWLSFAAVLVIFYVSFGRPGTCRRLSHWGKIQISLSVGLLPVTLLYFQQASLVAPVANFLFVPLVGFIIVPLLLLAVMVWPVFGGLSDLLLVWSANILGYSWIWLDNLAAYPLAQWNQSSLDGINLVLACLGVSLLLSPKGWPARWTGLVFLMPALVASPRSLEKGVYELYLLDVGQGLAAVIRTQNHVLVYDAGEKRGEKYNISQLVIIPFLRNLSLSGIDRLMISHGDSDHIGGAQELLDTFPGAQLVGSDIDRLNATNVQSCRQGQTWEWDGIEFEVLHPDRHYQRRNNRSCVVRISGPGGQLLLTGDIEKDIEQQLVADNPEALAANILVVPHHGSQTSSISGFIQAIRPSVALISAGYRNRYRLPNLHVVERYQRQGVQVLLTASSGMIRVRFDPRAPAPVIHQYRDEAKKYWHHRGLVIDD